jgi:Cd2+/Zn2+-exporting ATPase
MESVQERRFRIKNLDCASCAEKIETALRRVEGVDEVSLNFSTLTLSLKTKDVTRIIDEVRRIEPDVLLVPHNGKGRPSKPMESDSESNTMREFMILAGAGLLFGTQFFFEDALHRYTVPYAELVIVIAAYLMAGWNVILGAFRTIRRGDFFDENVLMVIATGGALAIHAYSEAVGVMIFYKVGELLQELAVNRSRRSIHSLLASRPDIANLQTATGLKLVKPEEVQIDDIVLVKPGDKVPLDGEVVSGDSMLDTSALTGEPTPRAGRVGTSVMAGMINLTSSLKIRVTKIFSESSIAKILDLVENASARKATTEKFITTFARWYTPAVVFIAAAIAVIPPLFVSGADFGTWIYRALVLLVISCPCALVVSIPLGYFGGIGRASRMGILVKGSNFIDALAAVKTVVFDKTGTLTLGNFVVQQVVTQNGIREEELLKYAAAAEIQSSHPIGKSILKEVEKRKLKSDNSSVTEHMAIPGRGVRAMVDGREVLVGNDALLHHQKIAHDICELNGTVAHVAVDGLYAGYILIGDTLKPEAPKAISDLRLYGVEQVVMLTGDNQCAAESVAKHLGMDAFYAGLLPEDKVRLLEEIKAGSNHGGKIAFVGDGINDAPVIARSDVGVAMGALGSDAAIETADVVLMTDSPSKMATAVKVAKETRKIVWQNIVMALSIKGLFIVLGAFGVASMWEAVFADMGVALAATANATRALGQAGPRPEP